jgi:eukaryotic-like serine/threonine-protein kinase
MILEQGQAVSAENSHTSWKVLRLLGSGGQGEVYSVTDGHQQRALKWYYPEHATREQAAALAELVRRGPPSSRFLWPLDLTRVPGQPSFGYLMPLREERFKGITDLMKRRARPTFRSLCTTCYELAEHYKLLHSHGLAYRDISLGNVFFDPQSGEIRIADNDNVAINGQASRGINGTPRFMAPEIVRGEADPSTETDLFSLAVLLFYMLFRNHPLEGAREAAIHCFDLPAMNKLYGYEPLFIFDPRDASNCPVTGYHDNATIYWGIYPQFLRDLFMRAFTEGLQPAGRVREGEWRRAFVRLRDSIVYGPSGAENFYDPAKEQAGRPHIDWHSQQIISLPPKLKVGDHLVLLTAEATLAAHHLRDNFDFDSVMARVSRHPSDPSIWGLKNESDADWSYTTAEGEVQIVAPGRNVTLKPGLVINFGPVQGEVLA